MRRRSGFVVAALVTAGCGAQALRTPQEERTAEPTQLSVAATMQQSSGRIAVQVSVRNAGSSEFVGEFQGVCAVAVLLWKSDDDRLRWDQQNWFNTRAGGCKWLLWPLRIPPDSEVEVITQVVSEASVLGDSLPAGDYDVAVRLRLVTPFDSTFVVAAGQATLSR